MSRSGFGTSNFLRYASGIVTTYPFTMACWGKTPTLATNQCLIGLHNSGAANLNRYRVGTGGSNDIVVQAADGAANTTCVTSTFITADTWFHACGVFASATDRRAFLNGGGKGTSVTSRTASGIDRTSIGVGDDSAADQPFLGDIAEAAIWNIALSDADVAALATGVSPLLVHPEALVGYWPLIGNNSPENNLVSNTSVMSIQGSLSAAAHPRIILPRRRQ